MEAICQRGAVLPCFDAAEAEDVGLPDVDGVANEQLPEGAGRKFAFAHGDGDACGIDGDFSRGAAQDFPDGLA